MIVIAVIGILAAIGLPQFLAYRVRSFNAAAKAVVNNLKSDNGNLNSESGIYGHTEANAFLLTNGDTGASVANTIVDQTLQQCARPGAAGARLVGTRIDGRQFAVGISLGRGMIAYVLDVNTSNNHSAHHTFARHNNGDTAYGFDSDLGSVLFSVSNGVWSGSGVIGADCPAPVIDSITDLEGVNGNGAPTSAWMLSK